MDRVWNVPPACGPAGEEALVRARRFLTFVSKAQPLDTMRTKKEKKSLQNVDAISIRSAGAVGIETELVKLPRERFADASNSRHEDSLDVREVPSGEPLLDTIKSNSQSRLSSVNVFSSRSSPASAATPTTKDSLVLTKTEDSKRKDGSNWKRFSAKTRSSMKKKNDADTQSERQTAIEDTNRSSRRFKLGITEADSTAAEGFEPNVGFEANVMDFMSPVALEAAATSDEAFALTMPSFEPKSNRRRGFVKSMLRKKTQNAISLAPEESLGVFESLHDPDPCKDDEDLFVDVDELVQSGQLEIGHETDVMTMLANCNYPLPPVDTMSSGALSHRGHFELQEVARVVREKSLVDEGQSYTGSNGTPADDILKDIQALQNVAQASKRKPVALRVDIDKTPRVHTSSSFKPRVITDPVDPALRQLGLLISPNGFIHKPSNFVDARKPSMPAEVEFPVDEEDDEDLVTLFTACEIGNRDVVKRQIVKKPHVVSKSKDGRTPLYYAARAGRVSIVKLLLAAGARDDYNECLKVTKNEKIRKLLRASSERNDENRAGRVTPIVRKLRPQQILQMVKNQKRKKATIGADASIRIKGSGISDLTSRSSSIAESLLDEDDEDELPMVAAEQIVKAAKYAMAMGDEASIFRNPKLTSDEREAARQVMVFLQENQGLLSP